MGKIDVNYMYRLSRRNFASRYALFTSLSRDNRLPCGPIVQPAPFIGAQLSYAKALNFSEPSNLHFLKTN